MSYHTYQWLDLPAPIRVGQGMYEAWRDDCRRGWTFEKITSFRQGDRVTLDIHVPASLDTQIALTSLAWVDKLIREALLPPAVTVFEYGLQRSGVPGRLHVKVFVGEGEASAYEPLQAPGDAPTKEAAE